MRPRALAAALLLAAGVVQLAPASAHESRAAAKGGTGRPVLTRFDWRSVMNFYRATAGLAPVREVGSWSRGARLHSRYIVRNGVLTHFEDPGKPFYTREGDRAARNGNISMATSSADASWTDRGEIEGWMTSPFHAEGMIDATLRSTGYAKVVEKRGGMWRLGSTLDVLRGRTGSASSRAILWPADGVQVPLRTYSGEEWPDPLTACKGYDGEAGLPILALFPKDVRVTGSSFKDGGTSLAHCAFDAHSYHNPDPGEEKRARDVLASRNTVVLIPREPLEDFHAYTARIETSDGRSVVWTFTVGEVEPPHDAQITGAVVSRTFQENPNFGVAWTALDEESGIGTYDVQWRRAPVGRDFTPWQAWLSNVTGSAANFAGEPGSTYCFKARATDKAGNRSGWSAQRCTSVPLRSADLEAAPVWLPLAGDYYAGQASLGLLPDSTLRTGVLRARRIALIATRQPGSGSVEILWDGKRIGVVDLEAPDTRHRLQIEVATFGRLRRGRITVRVLTPGAGVVVEGLGVARA